MRKWSPTHKEVDVIVCLLGLPMLAYWLINRALHLDEAQRVWLAEIATMGGVYLTIKRHW